MRQEILDSSWRPCRYDELSGRMGRRTSRQRGASLLLYPHLFLAIDCTKVELGRQVGRITGGQEGEHREKRKRCLKISSWKEMRISAQHSGRISCVSTVCKLSLNTLWTIIHVLTLIHNQMFFLIFTIKIILKFLRKGE